MMKDEELNNILYKTQMKIAIANLEQENKVMKNNAKYKMVASFILIFVLTTGVVFAVNYNKLIQYFGLGGGIDSAVENGYIEEPNQDYMESDTEANDEETGTIIDNIKVNAKIDDFLMDDLNLSTHFNFEFDEAIKETVNLDKLGSMEIKDLIVTDEEKRVIFCLDKKTFEEYCSNNNLPYTFGNFNENYMNNGLNNFIANKYAQNNTVILTYNMYADGYPKSKKLNFKFNTIVLTQGDKSEKDGKKVVLKGDWNISLDVPEKMYNRKSIAYKVISCSEDNFDVYKASVSDTGFEIGITVSNIKKPKSIFEYEEWKEIQDEYSAGKITSEEESRKLNELINTEKYREIMEKSRPFAISYNYYLGETIENASYVENANGKKFECTMSPSRRQNANFIGDDKFDFYETFGLTTYEATDKIKVRLLYYGNPVIIELERSK